MRDSTHKMSKTVVNNGGASGIWFMGFVGTLVYFLQHHSSSFWLVLVAIFKAVFWPAYLVYYALQFMKI